jgi:hypothetical protein
MRWPQLARYLQKHPKHVEYLYRPDASGNSKKPIEDGLEKELEELKLLVLFRDARVTAVVEGEAKDVDARLDEDAIRSLT